MPPPRFRRRHGLRPSPCAGGETIAFVGDSITHNGYHQMFLEYYYSTRFPETELQYLNRGTAGQSAFHLLRRMRTDILKPKADVYVLMVGMNDVGRKYFTREERTKNPKCEEEIARLESVYAERLAKVAEKLAENSRRLYIFSPSIFDETLESPTDPHVGGTSECRTNFPRRRALPRPAKSARPRPPRFVC